MAIKNPDRYQCTTLPPVIDDYIPTDDPVRAYDAMIDAMDIQELGLFKKWNKVGNSPYDPISMLKLLVYGYSYGWRSSRKLERALYHNLSFIWLMGGLKPDHKTISNFRKNNKACLKKALKQCVKICLALDLIEGNYLFLDGSKIRGNSSINQTKTKEYWEEKLAETEKRIEEILEEAEVLDEEESGNWVKMEEELADTQKLKEKIQSIIEKAHTDQIKKVNSTDPDAVNFKGRQGSHAGYNAQIVTDGKNGLIVSADVVNVNNDLNQASVQINQAISNIGSKCAVAVTDAGYFSIDDIKNLTDQNIDVVIPNQKQAAKTHKDDPFGRDKFSYDEITDEYICPEGKSLYYTCYSKSRDQYIYRMRREKDCLECQNFGVCTTAKRGRRIIRSSHEALKDQLKTRYETEDGQQIYKQRKEKAEHPFGHIKQNLNGNAFLVRGLSAVKAEFSLFASCFNITRMITLLGGVTPIINALELLK